MRIADIKAGKTYASDGRGLTIRKVLKVTDHPAYLWDTQKVIWLGDPPAPTANDQRCVLFEYEQQGKKRMAKMRLVSFARWAGYEVVDGRLQA